MYQSSNMFNPGAYGTPDMFPPQPPFPPYYPGDCGCDCGCDCECEHAHSFYNPPCLPDLPNLKHPRPQPCPPPCPQPCPPPCPQPCPPPCPPPCPSPCPQPCPPCPQPCPPPRPYPCEPSYQGCGCGCRPPRDSNCTDPENYYCRPNDCLAPCKPACPCRPQMCTSPCCGKDMSAALYPLIGKKVVLCVNGTRMRVIICEVCGGFVKALAYGCGRTVYVNIDKIDDVKISC